MQKKWFVYTLALLSLSATCANSATVFPNQSTLVTPPAATNNSVLNLGTWPVNTLNTGAKQFTLPAKCPTNYYPYVTIAFSEQAQNTSASFPPLIMSEIAKSKIRTCIQSVLPAAATNSYTINYLAATTYQTLTSSIIGRYYVSTNNAAYTVQYSTPLPFNQSVTVSTPVPNNAGIPKVFFTLYCYPPTADSNRIFNTFNFTVIGGNFKNGYYNLSCQ